MNFDDSFFEDDKQVQKKEDEYYPKICEPEVYRNMMNNPYNIVYF